MSTKPPADRYYFGYGSNMHREQMRRRCPTSSYYGRAFLSGWKFIICDSGYATIVPCTEADAQSGLDRTWGSVYTLEKHDEDSLDLYEGVGVYPPDYTKEEMECVICPPGTEEDETRWEKIVCMAYIATTSNPGDIKAAYIIRMGKAIADCEAPEEHLEKFIRPWLKKRSDMPIMGSVFTERIPFEVQKELNEAVRVLEPEQKPW
jgi:gamma-glutamylcyclotransferase